MSKSHAGVPTSHTCCENHTRACDIAASQNPIKFFFGNLTLILVGLFSSHNHRIEIQLYIDV
jgi:hypothetical protein